VLFVHNPPFYNNALFNSSIKDLAILHELAFVKQ